MSVQEIEPGQILGAALAQASLPTVAVLSERYETNLRWANNALTTNGEMHGRSLIVTSTAPVGQGGTAVATVSGNVAELGDVAAVVAAAEQAARSGPPAQEVSDLVGYYPHDDDVAAAPARVGVEVLARVATGLGEAFARARNDGHLLYGFAELVVETTYLASSTGLRRRAVLPTGRFELNGKSADLTRSAWVGQASRDFADIDVPAHYDELVTRLGWAEHRIDLPAGRYETLLPPGPVADLLIYAMWTANARDAEEGRNVFAAGEGRTRIGERLSPLPLTLLSDPAYPGEEAVPFVSAPMSEDGTSWAFDGGLPVPATHWLEDGVLRELVRNRAHADATGRQATPPADNLILHGGGTATLAEMIATTERGLLLTCLWYIREVDPERLLLTGLTRDGVYLIENGVVVGAVNNFRWNESPIELLDRITEVGATEHTLCREWNDYVNRTVMPPIRVPDFNMSTISQAS